MVRFATQEDINWMVNLSYLKRLEYSKVQPHFWKTAKNSNDVQSQYFNEEIIKDDVISLCNTDKLGFIFGKLITPPEVYDAGLTLMIDDFCVKTHNLWISVGKELLEGCIKISKDRGAKQVLVVSGYHDIHKNDLLTQMNLLTTSIWYTKQL
jgi:hypothetical protein